ncbi:hypothetical protein RE438_31360 (plasmid) [Bacillus wiedmannii]|uniref:hypothetical protein n=1 Tax=Bacillus wiedmannii TaxID=1890302 RepID=UPI00065C15B8|nr:hypothetical protein [Bacillus wiedmannii]KMP77367.1 hypothetical protein TU62_04680 [Bacillus cereus]WMS85366.1 hypothetical protein RE438_31360 [Bacillus wiedmannii]
MSLIEFIKKKGRLKSKELDLMNRFLIRLIVSKNIVQSESFCKMLIQSNIFSLENDDKVVMGNVFLKYIIEGLEEQSKLCQFKLSQNQIEKLFNKLKDDKIICLDITR